MLHGIHLSVPRRGTGDGQSARKMPNEPGMVQAAKAGVGYQSSAESDSGYIVQYLSRRNTKYVESGLEHRSYGATVDLTDSYGIEKTGWCPVVQYVQYVTASTDDRVPVGGGCQQQLLSKPRRGRNTTKAGRHRGYEGDKDM